MADITKITETLLQKFNKKESYEERKIIFWFDTENSLEDEYEELKNSLSQNDIKILLLKDNFFEIKKIIEIKEPKTNFLVYTTQEEKIDEENWLLDIQIYSSYFENSKKANIKGHLGIDNSKLDHFVEEHHDFFKNKSRLEAIKQFYDTKWVESDFEKGFFAIITKTKIIDFNMILRNLLINSLEEKENIYWQEIEKYGLTNTFWNHIKQQYGYYSDYPTLKKLFYSFIITHIEFHTKELIPSYNQYLNKKKNDSEVFLNSWIDSKDFIKYKEYTEMFESEHDHTDLLQNTFLNKDLNIFESVECLEFFDKLIILKIVNNLTSGGQDYKQYNSIILHRKNKKWYEEKYKSIYKALEYAIQFIELIKKEKIEQQNLSNLYNNYISKYYKIDLYYRKFYEYFDELSSDILKKKLCKEIENLYKTRYLEVLSEKWDYAIQNESLTSWKIGTNSMQNEFYDLYIDKYAKNDNKVVVIISDGLRYEVAVELNNKLKKELRGTTELKNLVGLIPSCTKIGMASLLPHKSLKYVNGEVFCDDMNTQGVINREKLLKLKNNASKAITFKDLSVMTRDQKREYFKGQSVIYLYHNTIDAAGDENITENKVFIECKTAINEIYETINDLTSAISISNIIVTADHGFIYNRDELNESDKVSINSFNDVIDSSKRYLVSSESNNLENSFKFKLDYMDDNIYAYVPKGFLRFKNKGSGLNYVHGGISPQEIVIPVLIYKHNRTDQDLLKKQIKHGYVNLELLNSSRKITTNMPVFNLYQTDRVTDKLKSINCKISLVDENEVKVSDEKTVILNSENEDGNKRVYPLTLTLKSNTQNKKHYLRIYEVNQDRVLKSEPFDVDLAMSNDFDDF